MINCKFDYTAAEPGTGTVDLVKAYFRITRFGRPIHITYHSLRAPRRGYPRLEHARRTCCPEMKDVVRAHAQPSILYHSRERKRQFWEHGPLSSISRTWISSTLSDSEEPLHRSGSRGGGANVVHFFSDHAIGKSQCVRLLIKLASKHHAIPRPSIFCSLPSSHSASDMREQPLSSMRASKVLFSYPSIHTAAVPSLLHPPRPNSHSSQPISPSQAIPKKQYNHLSTPFPFPPPPLSPSPSVSPPPSALPNYPLELRTHL